MHLVRESHYQLACTRYFEITHGDENHQGINHPNQYYEESRQLLEGKAPSSQSRPRPKVNVKKESDIKTENDDTFEELDDMQLMTMEMDETPGN